MIIKIDVDGVIRDTNNSMINLYNDFYPNKIMDISDMKDYSVYKSFPDNGINWHDFFFKNNAKKIFFESKVLDGAKRAIDMLKSDGHYIIIVTYQIDEINKKYTIDWLKNNHISYDMIAFTNEKQLVYGDILIDDSPHVLNKERSDVLCYCIDYEYNKDLNSENLRHKSSLLEVANEIINHQLLAGTTPPYSMINSFKRSV